jgi:hypothetical protein
VRIQRQDSPSPRAAGRGGESINQLPTRSNGTGGRAETYVVHGHQSLPATTSHQTRQDVRPAQSCSSSTCSDSAEHPEPGRSQKRCRLSQPWETAVARQVVLTPTGPRPALTKADLIVTLAASVRASDADASVPRKVTFSTGPAPSELPNQLPRSTRRRKKKRAAEQRRSFGPMEGGYASASLTGPSTKQRSCYAQLEALGMREAGGPFTLYRGRGDQELSWDVSGRKKRQRRRDRTEPGLYCCRSRRRIDRTRGRSCRS